MLYQVLADLVVFVHLAFIAFAALGGVLVLWRRGVAWAHVPAVVWAVAVELAGWLCPLTPLENYLLVKAGAAGYESGFLEHYVFPVLYPAGLTRPVQTAIGAVVLLLNAAIYGYLIASAARRRARRDTSGATMGE